VSAKTDAKVEFRCIMERLARDLKLHRISPQELIKIVLPSKAIKNERILETLMYQANSGKSLVIAHSFAKCVHNRVLMYWNVIMITIYHLEMSPLNTFIIIVLLITFIILEYSGMYRIQDSYLEACQERLQKQDSRYSEFGESFDCGL
jgi:hypothetical protein